MSRVYEVMFIVRPDVAEEDLDKLIAGFETTVTNGGGAIKSTEKMGRRKLAYTVRKFNDGNYILLTIEADGPLVAELERRLRVSEPVIKFITVRTDEEEKRIAKIKAIRGTRTKRSAEPVSTPVQQFQPAPAQPVQAQPVQPVAAPAPVAAEPAEPVQASA
jgi:small subunit ribosomal protein S6